MTDLLRRFLDICLLRAGPQDLPASRFLAALSLVVYSAVGLLMAMQNVGPLRAVLLVLVDAVLLAGLVFALLWIRDMLGRYLQALTAFLGTGAIMELVAMPVLIWQPGVPTEPLTPGMVAATLLLWAWLLWSLVVIGHILRHTLSTVFPVGVMLGLLYMFVSFSVTRTLFLSSAG